jgi:hypothetical protein
VDWAGLLSQPVGGTRYAQPHSPTHRSPHTAGLISSCEHCVTLSHELPCTNIHTSRTSPAMGITPGCSPARPPLAFSAGAGFVTYSLSAIWQPGRASRAPKKPASAWLHYISARPNQDRALVCCPLRRRDPIPIISEDIGGMKR